jgi:hypothetical protein
MGWRMFFGCALLCGGVLASCSDATAPSGIVVTVSPDTVHIAPGQAASFSVSARTPPAGTTWVWPDRLDLESEPTPGDWRAVADITDSNPYLTSALGDASTTSRSGAVAAWMPRQASLNPGRYRVRLTFHMSAPNATQETGDVFTVTSNTFVVVPP